MISDENWAPLFSSSSFAFSFSFSPLTFFIASGPSSETILRSQAFSWLREKLINYELNILEQIIIFFRFSKLWKQIVRKQMQESRWKG